MGIEIYQIKDLEQVFKCSKSHLFAYWFKHPFFPAPVIVGENKEGWRSDEIDKFIIEKLAHSTPHRDRPKSLSHQQRRSKAA